MEDLDLYDEFGNYLGPDLDNEEIEENIQEEDEMDEREDKIDSKKDDMDEKSEEENIGTIVLHEDKEYYPEASEIYPEAETLVQDEDTQPLSQPIINPIKKKIHREEEKEIPETNFNKQFLTDLMNNGNSVRNISLIGNLHHGKTSFLDIFVKKTHPEKSKINSEKLLKYTNTRKDEIQRGLTIKSKPISLVLQNLNGKSFLLNIMDTPGHVNFSDEVTAALRISDGVVLVVDVIEGVLNHTKNLIFHALSQNLPITLFINKLDRLVLESRFPPKDAYFKIKEIIDIVNSHILQFSQSNPSSTFSAPLLSPRKGNVLFGSSLFGFCFSLLSFAKIYNKKNGGEINEKMFAERLWGDIYYNALDRNFKGKPSSGASQRTFVSFILEPLYKIFSFTVSEKSENLKDVLSQLGVYLKPTHYEMNNIPLLRLIISKFLGDSNNSFVDAISQHIPSPLVSPPNKLPLIFPTSSSYLSSNKESNNSKDKKQDPEQLAVESMLKNDKDGPLIINIVKNYESQDGSTFESLGRIFSGTIRKGDRLRVLGEGYSILEEEDVTVREVTSLAIFQSRYNIEMEEVGSGNWVLIGGVSDCISKTATLMWENMKGINIFTPLSFMTIGVCKVAVEPLNPSELPKMLDGLRKLDKSYPLLHTKVEESGEHVLVGTGELYLDCVLYDIRNLFTEIEIKVSDPVVSFCETVVDTSTVKCFAHTPNQGNKLTFICEPLEKEMALDIENDKIPLYSLSKENLSSLLREKYEWDILASKSLWAFGPSPKNGPNILLDDTLPSEVDKNKLSSCRDSIVQGFQWSTREGPLCEEPIRSVKFKILDATLADEPFKRGAGQIIPTSRRVCYSSFLTATPRLMEPVFFVEILAPEECVAATFTILARRRGNVLSETLKPGTPFTLIQAHLPVMDSYGFETDLRCHTQGMAFCTTVFDHWQNVPGDPLDKNVLLKPLQPSQTQDLAREFVVKTRRRKGLSDDVAISHFFDEKMILNTQNLFNF
eukprot:TRINITY_DN4977_c0_g1_i1.p1 TRINITY_DN4977_c0_g1~~TRINITY_DN4977_c0_g1_i1.p1  ORF type:complete len:998 (+),score=338.88 TRINITY_DN4977_c0_g1_i1:24-3017(+)